MRKVGTACLALLALVLLAASSQASTEAQDDGCLVVAEGRGIVSMTARGFVIGRFDQGQVDVEDTLLHDGSVRVFGFQKRRVLSETKTRYIGSLVRFRASGQFRIRTEAVGMEVSLAGKGSVTLSSDGFLDAGRYSTDAQSFCESRFQPMPDVPRKILIAEQTAA